MGGLQRGCRRRRRACGMRNSEDQTSTSWRPSRYRYRKSATVTTSPPDVPVALPSSIFDFVPGTSPSWSSKVCTLHGRTLYVWKRKSFWWQVALHGHELQACSTSSCQLAAANWGLGHAGPSARPRLAWPSRGPGARGALGALGGAWGDRARESCVNHCV